MTTKLIQDYYYEFYNSKDKEGKRMLTTQVITILDSIPPKSMAMAIVAMMNWNTAIMDAEELNQ